MPVCEVESCFPVSPGRAWRGAAESMTSHSSRILLQPMSGYVDLPLLVLRHVDLSFRDHTVWDF